MAYITKIIGKDEELIGIARLHWIYVVKGIVWFIILTAAGWFLDSLISRAAIATASATGGGALPSLLLTLSNGAMYFMMFAGALIFFFFTLKVLVEEIGLSSRRVMHKTGLVFIKVKQIDLEEIRGENLDLGYFGRLLGYGYLLLDCRFIGDVRLPAIEKPERFLKALHERRARSQDSLSVVLGKGNAAPLNVEVPQEMQQAQQQPQQPQPEIPAPQPQQPEIQPPQPGPEINPPQPGPEIAPPPVPHGPPLGSPPSQPEQPQQPVPQQPTPAPPPSEPPLQPPASVQVQPQPAAAQPAAPQAASIDPQIVQQVLQQAMPQMAQQVAQELAAQGLKPQSQPQQPEATGDVDTDLIQSFDGAALDKDASHNDRRNSMEHSIH